MFFIPSPPKQWLAKRPQQSNTRKLINVNKSENKWSDIKKWWLDLAKSLFIWGLGLFISFYYIRDFEKAQAREKFLEETDFRLNLQKLEEFKHTSTHLSIAALRLVRNPTNLQRIEEYATVDSINYELASDEIQGLIKNSNDTKSLKKSFNLLEEHRAEMSRQLHAYVIKYGPIYKRKSEEDLGGTTLIWDNRYIWTTEGLAFHMAKKYYIEERQKVIEGLESLIKKPSSDI